MEYNSFCPIDAATTALLEPRQLVQTDHLSQELMAIDVDDKVDNSTYRRNDLHSNVHLLLDSGLLH